MVCSGGMVFRSGGAGLAAARHWELLSGRKDAPVIDKRRPAYFVVIKITAALQARA